MNIETLTLEPNKLSAELGKKIRWGRKLDVAASATMTASIEKAAAKSSPPAGIEQNGLMWEILPGSPPLQRVMFRSRTGQCWSYPYGYIAMIESHSPTLITLRCTGNDTESISIHGIGLNGLMLPLCEHRLAMLCESNNPLIATDGMIVREILIAERKNEKPRAL